MNLAETMRPLLSAWNGSDYVSQWEFRLRGATGSLPPSAEIEFSSKYQWFDALADPKAAQDYYLTQYVLAPRVLVPGQARAIAIAVLGDSPDVVVPPGFSTKHVGEGVVIIQRK